MLSIDHVTLVPTHAKTVQDVMDNANNCDKEEFSTDKLQEDIHTKNSLRQNVVYNY